MKPGKGRERERVEEREVGRIEGPKDGEREREEEEGSQVPHELVPSVY